MPRMMTFEQALEDAHIRCGDHLTVLLGNGFSIAFDPTIFRYESLWDEAEMRNLSISKSELFDALQSTDFEVVIDRLRSAANLIAPYGGDRSTARTLRSDARVVRNALADVIAARHPESSSDVTNEQAGYARRFLHNFEFVYTLSYDLLLYWVVMRREVPPRVVPMRDGFERATRENVGPLLWKSNPMLGQQQIYYLHGALHHFVEDVDGFEKPRLTKLRGSFTRIVTTLRRRLDANRYPQIVTEGTNAEKIARIERSQYLRTALRRFGESRGAVFLHGASMDANDDHIWETLERETSKVTALYVGIHGNGTTAGARSVIARAQQIRERRESGGGQELRLKFYDAASAHVWR